MPDGRPSPWRGVWLTLLLVAAGTACRGQDRGQAAREPAVDSLLPRVEAVTGLKARQPLKVQRRDRSALREYVTEQLERELPPAELAGIEAAYEAFGLLPDTLDLRRLLLNLYTEQVVGYYDPPTKTLYLVEGVAGAALRPVLAHEMVHALQDQYADLDSLVSREDENDRQTAAQAAIEGHATLVMFLLLAEGIAGQPIDPAALPDLGPQLRPALEAENSQFPVFRTAPRIIRETLLFPYLAGAAFVQALWRDAASKGAPTPRPAPFGALLPLSTEHVIHPERFLQTRDAPTAVTLAPHQPAGGWNSLYENTLGEFEVSILLSEHLGAAAAALARGWDGDRFRVLERQGGGRALVWYSVWDDAASADAFAAAYRRILQLRPGHHGTVERIDTGAGPGVRVVQAAADLPLAQVPPVEIRRVQDIRR